MFKDLSIMTPLCLALKCNCSGFWLGCDPDETCTVGSNHACVRVLSWNPEDYGQWVHCVDDEIGLNHQCRTTEPVADSYIRCCDDYDYCNGDIVMPTPPRPTKALVHSTRGPSSRWVIAVVISLLCCRQCSRL